MSGGVLAPLRSRCPRGSGSEGVNGISLVHPAVRTAVAIAMLSSVTTVRTAFAQIPFPPPPPRLPEKIEPLPPPPQILPPVPPVPPRREPAPPVRMFVHDIHVVGNVVFTEEQLNEVTRPYKGRELTAEDLEAVRLALTLYYVDRGYVTSGAIIPDQAVTFGVLTIQIIEGRLSRIDIEVKNFLWSGYLRSRILPGVTTPLNVNPLQERLQFLQLDPRIERVNAELKPDDQLGHSILNVQVKEAPLLHGRIAINNYQSPTVGSVQGLGTIEDTNLTGLGDTLSFTYGRSSGINPIYDAKYAIPVNRYDTTISAQYRRFDFVVEEEQFQALDIRNNAEIFSFSIRQPLYRTLQDEFAVSVIFEYEKNTSTLLGQPFDFVAGSTNGLFVIAPLRFAQEYVHRTSEQVISAFSRFTVGLGAFDATGGSNVPDSATSRFFSWLGEAQWVRQLTPLRTQMLARTTMQFSNNHLFPLEQVSVGGRYSVRGYREYTLVRDNAFLASLEFRVPVFTTSDGLDRLHLATFADVGQSWNTNASNQAPAGIGNINTGPINTLGSVGLGLIVTITEGIRFEIYKGFQLNFLDQGTGNLQDYGVHFGLTAQVFDFGRWP